MPKNTDRCNVQNTLALSFIRMEGMKVGDDEATALWSMFAMEEIQRSFGVLRLETAESHKT